MTNNHSRIETLPGGLISLAEKKAGVSLSMVAQDPNALGSTDLLMALAWVIEKTDNDYEGTYEEFSMSRTLIEVQEILGVAGESPDA